MNSALDVVSFPNRKQDGRLSVLDTDGTPLAWIQVPWGGRGFTAVFPDGRPLCSGRTRLFARTLDVVDGAGAPLLTLAPEGWGSRRRIVTRSDGSEYTLLGGSWLNRDWTLVHPSGQVALCAASEGRTLFSATEAFAVQLADPTLTLAELIGIVQGDRILDQAERARRRANS